MLSDGGKVSLNQTQLTDELNSFLKASGFTQVEANGDEVRAVRAQWLAAAAPLRRKKVEVTTQPAV